ncbi:MAG: 4Fe-4S dicluster domain-containing protein [Saprospiraceae bacterium]|jgi:ferredoxin
MAIKITDECINCGACEPECPNHAIYENGFGWTPAEGTAIQTDFKLFNGQSIDAYSQQEPISADYYYIVPEKCTECVGFHEEPQCASVCPVDCCVPDDHCVESNMQLEEKQRLLHKD